MRHTVGWMCLVAGVLLCCGQAWCGERVIATLNDGSKVEGEVLKKDSKVVYLSIAGTVLPLHREEIKELTTASGAAEDVKDVRKAVLYHTASRPVKSVAAHAEELGAAIVVVKTPSGLGTGWFCSPDGYVVTNHHVVANERSISITAYRLEQGRFGKEVFKKVKLIALDEHLDLALLKIEDDLDLEIPQLYIGDSTVLKEGDDVFTIGNPMGLERSTSQGIVSKVNRNMAGRLYVQTTAPISPGNSGGPLFNERGEVIGVTNMGYVTLDGLGFAIPSLYVKEFLDNVEAFAYDPDNPNAGIKYMETPLTATDGSLRFTESDFIKVGRGISCLNLADMDGDGVKEAVFVNNVKSEIGILRRRRPGETEALPTDFEDINRIPDSAGFKLETHAVSNSISSLAVADMDGDGRPDIVFHGDIDGLAVLVQQGDGTFAAPRRIHDFEIAKRTDALQVADMDGDGRPEIFALGREEFAVFETRAEPSLFPLNSSYRSSILRYELRDVNADGRLDVLLFSADKFYALHVLLQNEDGGFVEEQQVALHLSGPVEPYEVGDGAIRFLTLDKGQNRVRELVLDVEMQEHEDGRVNTAIQTIALEADTRGADDFEIADLDGDGRLDIVTVNRAGNEFMVFSGTEHGFRVSRSPSPRKVSGLRLYQTADGKAVLFSYSQEDKIFGISRAAVDGVTFPRPIDTDGWQVQSLSLADVDGAGQMLIWVQKGDGYQVGRASAEGLAQTALAVGEGSIEAGGGRLEFSEDGVKYSATLRNKPERLAFADFNGDGVSDVVVYWSYSGKESLYLGVGEGKFRAVIVDQEFLEVKKGQPLLVADIDDDGDGDVLLVQPGFVRVLKVDAKDKLYVAQQFNWQFDEVTELVPYPEVERGRFVALAGKVAKIVEFDVQAGKFRLVASIDLAGFESGHLKTGDVDGNGRTDLLLLAPGAVHIVYNRDERPMVRVRNVFDARLDYFTYWNVRPADLDGDGKDEVMLFDSKKAMFEIYRTVDDGTLKPICRQRLFEKSILQRGETDSNKLPQELAVGDLDGNGMADLVFILQDRVAVYSQSAGD